MSSGRHRYSKPRLTLLGLAGGALVAAVTAIALTLGTGPAAPARAGAAWPVPRLVAMVIAAAARALPAIAKKVRRCLLYR